MSNSLIAACARTALSAALLTALTTACSAAPPARAAAAPTGAPASAKPPAVAKPAAAQATVPDQPATADKTAAQQAAAAPASGADKGPQPPDGKWLKDKDGREYYLEKIEKRENTYRRLNEKQVRTRWGIDIDVVKEDDKFFYYKFYRPEAPAPRPAAQGPSPEELAAAYQTATKEAETLRFVPLSQGLPTAGQWRNGFDLADVNGDGHLDIVHGPARKEFGGPVVFLGDGKGNWKRWREAKYPRLAYDYGDAVTADFNGDGHVDIALGMHLRGLAVLLGDGKGNFTDSSKGLDFSVAGSKGSDGSGFSSRALAVADWNGDKRPDILALGEGPRLNLSGGRQPTAAGISQAFGVVVYLNRGDGSWERRDQGTGRVNIFGDAIDAADLSGDGKPDFAIGSNAMGRQDLVGIARADGGWDQPTISLVRPRSFVRDVEAADFDGDGRMDLAVAYTSSQGSWRTGVDLLLGRPEGNWERKGIWMEESREGVFALSSGDLDGDGGKDLVALTGDGRTWVFRGDGKGAFAREKAGVPQFPGACRGYNVELGDVDGDGDDEIIAAFAGESSAMFAPDLCPSGGGITAWNAVPGASQSNSTALTP
jgi:FG-GAP-like repeat